MTNAGMPAFVTFFVKIQTNSQLIHGPKTFKKTANGSISFCVIINANHYHSHLHIIMFGKHLIF